MAQNLSHNVALSDGTSLPLFGLGTYQTKNKDEITNLIRTALDIGYRHIDTAILYFNEELIGQALQTIFSEGKYKREDLYIVTKIFPIKTNNVLECLQKSLKDLQIDYVDLFYLHWPFSAPTQDLVWQHKPVHVIWAELEDVQKRGLTRSLGVSNFNVQSLVDLLSYAKVKPVSNQIELHVYLQQNRLVEFCKKANIHVTAYCPLARYGDVAKDATIQKIATKYNVPISQVLLAFLLNLGISVIPKTEKIERLQENFDSIKVKFSEEDLNALKALDKNLRIVQPYEMELFQYIPIFD